MGKTGYDGNNLRNGNTLAGGDLDWMLSRGFIEKDLIPYNFPSLDAFEKNKIQVVYLGWFLGDWSLLNNGSISALSGFKPRQDNVENTGDLYGVSAVDENWVSLNQMIKYYKFGFGKVTEYVNEMIRAGIISRSEGIKLAEKYDGSCSDEYISEFCEFLEMSTEEFWNNVHRVTNKKLFIIGKDAIIKRNFIVGKGIAH